MISVTEAKQLIQQHTPRPSGVYQPIEQCGGLTLAEDIYAKGDFPPFVQSSMDGYAFRFSDFNSTRELFLNGEVQAGAAAQREIETGQAVRIFTGAPLPHGADTVVMQEKVKAGSQTLLVEDENIRLGLNTRPAGSDIASGALACKAGTTLSAAAIGFLAGIGNDSLPVYPRPRISIIVTGKELQNPGKPLSFGQVFESNSYALRSVLAQLQLNEVLVKWADDDPQMLEQVLSEALRDADLILLAGGISVGDYDFVLETTQKLKVRQIFHKVRQRPGKPLFFGVKENKPVFGLPGNPSSVLTCFYEYVMPCIEVMMQKKPLVRKSMLPIRHDYTKTTGLTHFLKGYADDSGVTPLQGQESYRMSSYAQANCLILCEENRELYKQGEEVEIHWTDYFAG